MTEPPPDLHGPQQRPRRCRATSKRTGVQCGSTPAVGFTTCKWHGAATTIAKVKAAERVVEIEAAKVYARFAPATPVDDPIGELAALAGEVQRWRRFCESRLGEIENLRYEGLTAEQIRGEVLLYERAMDRCSTVLVAIAKLDIEKRMTAVNERLATSIEQVLTAAFEQLDLTDRQRSGVPAAIEHGLALVR